MNMKPKKSTTLLQIEIFCRLAKEMGIQLVWDGDTQAFTVAEFEDTAEEQAHDSVLEADHKERYRPDWKDPRLAVGAELNRLLVTVLGEREYQDKKWGAGRKHEVGAWLTLVHNYIAYAETAWCRNSNDDKALHELRKVLALGMACAEQHGLPERKA